MTESHISTDELERRLMANLSDDDEDFEKNLITAAPYNTLQGQRKQQVETCNGCEKEYDSSQLNADPGLGLCSACNVSKTSNHIRDNCRKSPTNSPGSSKQVETVLENQSKTGGSGDTDGNLDADAEIVPVLEEELTEKLPVHIDTYSQGEIPGYTDFKDAKELGAHFMAAKLSHDGNTLVLKIGNLKALEFEQSRDPNAYAISGKQGFWRLLIDPYARAHGLLLYGYDLYDAWQYGEVAVVCYCMIIGADGYPTGNVLFKIGRTRCPAPRVDGFVYDIREDRCYRVINFRIYMKDKWTKPAFDIDFNKIVDAWEMFLVLYRFEVDPSRTIHRDCKYPMKKDPPKKVGSQAIGEGQITASRLRSQASIAMASKGNEDHSRTAPEHDDEIDEGDKIKGTKKSNTSKKSKLPRADPELELAAPKRKKERLRDKDIELAAPKSKKERLRDSKDNKKVIPDTTQPKMLSDLQRENERMQKMINDLSAAQKEIDKKQKKELAEAMATLKDLKKISDAHLKDKEKAQERLEKLQEELEGARQTSTMAVNQPPIQPNNAMHSHQPSLQNSSMAISQVVHDRVPLQNGSMGISQIAHGHYPPAQNGSMAFTHPSYGPLSRQSDSAAPGQINPQSLVSYWASSDMQNEFRMRLNLLGYR